MLARYPLPEGWVEVYDGGMARHYYWNQDTDEVRFLYLFYLKSMGWVCCVPNIALNIGNKKESQQRRLFILLDLCVLASIEFDFLECGNSALALMFD